MPSDDSDSTNGFVLLSSLTNIEKKKVDANGLQCSGFNHVGQRMSCHGGNPKESTSFRFSVSRLPKWAQEKVTECGKIPTRPKCFILQEHPPLCGRDHVAYRSAYFSVKGQIELEERSCSGKFITHIYGE